MIDTTSGQPSGAPEGDPLNYTDPFASDPFLGAGANMSFDGFDIDPEDSEIAAGIFDRDPLSLPSPVPVKGEPKLSGPSLAGLPDDVRQTIERELAHTPAHLREHVQGALVQRAAEHLALKARIRSGFGDSADPYLRERAAIATEIRELSEERARHVRDIQAIRGYELVWDDDGSPMLDPETGQQFALPIPTFTEETRKARLVAIADIDRRIRLLRGVEGERRLKTAMREAVAAEKAVRAQLAERADAKKLAEQMLRDERVRKQAESMVRMRRNEL